MRRDLAEKLIGELAHKVATLWEAAVGALTPEEFERAEMVSVGKREPNVWILDEIRVDGVTIAAVKVIYDGTGRVDVTLETMPRR